MTSQAQASSSSSSSTPEAAALLLKSATVPLEEKKQKLQFFSPQITSYFIAGGCAGAASRTVVSPLERLKIIQCVPNVSLSRFCSRSCSCLYFWGSRISFVVIKTSPTTIAGWSVQGRMAKSCPHVERGRFQGLHAGQRYQLFTNCPIQVFSTLPSLPLRLLHPPSFSLSPVSGSLTLVANLFSSAVQFTTYEQLKKVGNVTRPFAVL